MASDLDDEAIRRALHGACRSFSVAFVLGKVGKPYDPNLTAKADDAIATVERKLTEAGVPEGLVSMMTSIGAVLVGHGLEAAARKQLLALLVARMNQLVKPDLHYCDGERCDGCIWPPEVMPHPRTCLEDPTTWPGRAAHRRVCEGPVSTETPAEESGHG